MANSRRYDNRKHQYDGLDVFRVTSDNSDSLRESLQGTNIVKIVQAR